MFKKLKEVLFPNENVLANYIYESVEKTTHNELLTSYASKLSQNYLSFNLVMLEVAYNHEFNEEIPEQLANVFNSKRRDCNYIIEKLEQLGETIPKEIIESLSETKLENYMSFNETMEYVKKLQNVMNSYFPTLKV